MNNDFSRIIADELSLDKKNILNTVRLLDDGCTVPFISRYRKEMTGGLDEVCIFKIQASYEKLKELAKRKQTIINTIEQQGQLTDELRQRINVCWDADTLEDIYLPYKPKRRTRAQVAREHGLEPLAMAVMMRQCRRPSDYARRFINDDVATAADALKGANDIMAELINNDEHARAIVRKEFRHTAMIVSKVVKSKSEEEECARYSDYFDFQEPLSRCPSHRLLAMLRGANKGFLRVGLSVSDDVENKVSRVFTVGNDECSLLIREAAHDACKRLLLPAIETEFMRMGREAADDEAIDVFSNNLRQLLLASPLGQKAVMGVDPGFRTGCKVACVSAEGKFLHYENVFPLRDAAHASKQLVAMARDYGVEAIAIGNGTASRETENFIRGIDFGRSVDVFVVSEDGASVYSASKSARDEFPDLDVTVRGAISIARRLIDPLSELVKIDPKSIGVGQYQHDVDQVKLKTRLSQVVETCVNAVGVNVNTASRELLSYVSGIGDGLAQNIVDYRKEHGAFKSRNELKKVKRLGENTFTQCAGFLRIPGSKNPLDNSGVHPESYHIVERMATDMHCTVSQLVNNKDLQKDINVSRYIGEGVGMPTLRDIMAELNKPGRDPRPALETFAFDPSVSTITDLSEGMVLPGIVSNITNFGTFVNIGVHQDGLVHVSQLSSKYISSPLDVVRLNQHVKVKVIGVDIKRKRISLSMILDN